MTTSGVVLVKPEIVEDPYPKKMKKAVVLLSGGLDSAVTAYIAREDIGKKGELYALTFKYGQTHRRELLSASDIGEALRVAGHPLIEIPLDKLVKSSLVGTGDIPTEGVKEGIPSTWVPQRNSIFLALAFAYAETLGADRVYIGVNSIDYSGYPDCRPEFIEQVQKALNLASKQFVEVGKGIGIITPLQYKRKWEIVQLGSKLGVPLELTWSCYQGREKACGVCDSCRLRLKAFKLAGLKDPIEYEEV